MKKTLLFALLSVLSVVLGFTSCCDTDGIDEKGVPVADITFSVSTGELILGGDPALATTKLTVIVTPENATEKSVVWSSSDETVATVSEDGVVTAVGEGTAIITATAKDGSGKSATYTVTVNATSQMKAKFDISEQYTKVTKGSDNVWTRAAMTQDGADFKFAYEVGDKVEVTNIEILRSESPYYTFTLGADDMFYSKDAKATETATMWIAVFPEHEVSLANQSGKLEDLSKVYQLLGSANTTGAEGLDIKMNATCAVLVIDNQKGDIDINVTFENGKWVETMVMGQHGEASDTKVSLLKTSVKGKYYIVVPARTTEGVNLPLNIYDGENKIMSTKTGLTAGCYYDLTVAEAPVSGEEWTTALMYGMGDVYSLCTKIVIELGKQKPEGATDLNDDGTVWGKYDAGTKTIYVQSSSPNPIKIATMGMFSLCESVETIEGLGNTVIGHNNLGGMFQNCKNLTSLDLSSFDTKNVTSFAQMFSGCEKLTSLDLSKFDTKKVTTLVNMFKNCKSLTTLDLSNFDTKNVTNFNYMFQNCEKLTSLNLSSFDTSKATDMMSMFYGCKLLETLTLSNNIKINTGTKTSYIFMNVGSGLTGGKKCTIKGVTDESLKEKLANFAYGWNEAYMQFE